MDLDVELDMEKKNSRLNNLVAITVALLSIFLALTKIKDDNIVEAMLKSQSNAVDTWNEYQAKKIKQHLMELGQGEAVLFDLNSTGIAKKTAQEHAKIFSDQLADYKLQEKEIKEKAESFEKRYEELEYRNDQFHLADAVLSIALALLAVTALTEKRWLLYFAWVFTGLGVFLSIVSFLALPFHPDWFIGLLK